MARLTLFYHLQDVNAEQAILELAGAADFNKLRSVDDLPWIEQLEANHVDVAIIELSSLSREDYLGLLDNVALSNIEFIFLSDGQPNPNLDQLMSHFAGYHFRKPYDMTLISDIFADFAQYLVSSPIRPRPFSSELDQYGLLVGSSAAMHKLYRTIRRVSATDSNVLIIGESGAGKELVANTIHLASPRLNEPFIAINCGALSPELVDSELFGHVKGAFTGAHRDHKGVFEQAEGGTLFLDEVTEMPIEHQVKLLRVLENSEYRPVGGAKVQLANVRIVAATNRDPIAAIEAGQFREDLYFRLAQFPIRVPPLRERGDDILGLAQHFLAYRNVAEKQNKSLADDSAQMIAAYPWSGNVRELKHAIERAYILADQEILPSHLQLPQASEMGASGDDQVVIPQGMRLDDLEKIAIYQALETTQGNKTDTAEQLGISVKTLYNKLSKYEQQVEAGESNAEM
ncbi:sigma-54 dependent transcriptional regulator [Shewanella baltica]|uniref:Sigma54 specific transcriptional regulator, Fis family n=1 Tax=Shewanella baltica (strain OS155 / ATCC BAA-1091) TaxID=325240 RepID=A3D2H2_SHEB5|nr:sigma-54 dependent transcriptional regulator [Shewanella baltica]ABN60935.1 sigma54 specific transcriptional regulator, Fis family [Shewanella baltica OS155]AEH13284.1 sigma54 specific transcriptional regulator, Fis family [Shewanella baltica OS117]MCS6117615.1 sigma-54-dependent Fis family transcriptional regulator [Shewanella baltica]MCS6178077.1 sigma-54-dependent Fis family transcriptional regulator [Shewanella baltica]MCS6254223.1 sigma-54-dependent Fis family transcriptional regulator